MKKITRLLVVFLSTYQLINLSTVFAYEVELSGFFNVLGQARQGENTFFGIGPFEIDVASEFSSEIRFEGGIFVEGDEVGLGPTFLNFRLLDEKLSLQTGLFDIPFGIDYLVFDTPLRKLVTPPIIAELMMDGGWGGVGINLYGSSSYLNYNLYVVNGMGEDNGTPVNQTIDNNDGKTIGGRIGVLPIKDLEIGVSITRGPYLDDNIEEVLSRIGCDIQFAYGPLKLKGEVIIGKEEIPSADANEHSGYYVQLLGNATEKLYGALRYGGWEPKDGDRITRLTITFGYDLIENASIRIEYQLNNETPKLNNNLLSTQVVISF